jgi:hypothetical protein
MALSRFRVRNPERDRETDRDRQQRLRRFLGDIRAEMERERDGLQARYEKVMADAAFSQQALEDDSVGVAVSSKIDDMTEAMIHYTKRMASLETQIGFVIEADQRIERFFEENADR